MSNRSVKEECLTRMSSKSVLQECHVRSVLEECLTKVSNKSVLPERCAIVSSKGVLQECHLSVSTQGVSQMGSLENVRCKCCLCSSTYVSAFGFVGFILFFFPTIIFLFQAKGFRTDLYCICSETCCFQATCVFLRFETWRRAGLENGWLQVVEQAFPRGVSSFSSLV